MSDLSYYRDEIIRAALHSITKGTSVDIAISAAVDSALEFALMDRLNHETDVPLAKALTEHELREATFLVATRRQVAPPALPPTTKKESPWWKLNQ